MGLPMTELKPHSQLHLAKPIFPRMAADSPFVVERLKVESAMSAPVAIDTVSRGGWYDRVNLPAIACREYFNFPLSGLPRRLPVIWPFPSLSPIDADIDRVRQVLVVNGSIGAGKTVRRSIGAVLSENLPNDQPLSGSCVVSGLFFAALPAGIGTKPSPCHEGSNERS